MEVASRSLSYRVATPRAASPSPRRLPLSRPLPPRRLPVPRRFPVPAPRTLARAVCNGRAGLVSARGRDGGATRPMRCSAAFPFPRRGRWLAPCATGAWAGCWSRTREGGATTRARRPVRDDPCATTRAQYCAALALPRPLRVAAPCSRCRAGNVGSRRVQRAHERIAGVGPRWRRDDPCAVLRRPHVAATSPLLRRPPVVAPRTLVRAGCNGRAGGLPARDREGGATSRGRATPRPSCRVPPRCRAVFWLPRCVPVVALCSGCRAMFPLSRLRSVPAPVTAGAGPGLWREVELAARPAPVGCSRWADGAVTVPPAPAAARHLRITARRPYP